MAGWTDVNEDDDEDTSQGPSSSRSSAKLIGGLFSARGSGGGSDLFSPTGASVGGGGGGGGGSGGGGGGGADSPASYASTPTPGRLTEERMATVAARSASTHTPTLYNVAVRAACKKAHLKNTTHQLYSHSLLLL